MWAFKKVSGSCLYYFQYLHFIREILRFLFFKTENGTLIQRSLPIWMVHYRQYPPGPHGLSKSYWHRGLYPSPLPSPAPLTSLMFIRTAKVYSGEWQKLSTQQHFSFILKSCFMISTLFSIAFTFFSMLIVIKIVTKSVSWPRRDLNTQPSDLESDALPLRHGVNGRWRKRIRR